MRQVELTEQTVVVDGRDVSDWCRGYQLTINVGDAPRLVLDSIVGEVAYAGPAYVEDVPFDGIARLRERLGG